MKDTAPFPVEGLEILFKAQTATSVLREIVFKLAMMGRLAKQDPREGTGEDAIAACRSHRQRLVARGKLRNPAALPNVSSDERLFVVPKTWAWTRFGEIGDWGSGATPSRGNSAYYGGKTPWLKSGELNDGYVDQAEEHVTDSALRDCSLRLNSPGDVLIAMYGATIGKVALLRTVATTNQAVCACTCFEGIDNEFLLRLLRAYKSIFVDQGAGGAQPNISKVKIVETPCPVPPLAEQKRIVAKVDQLMALCDDLEAKQTKKRDLATQSTRSALTALTTAETAEDLAAAWRRVAKNFEDVLGDAQGILALKDAVLALAVRGQIENAAPGDESIEHVADRLSRARDAWAAKARGNHDALPEVEGGPFEVARWRWIRLGNLAEIVGGVAKGRKLAGRQVTSFPYLRVANVQRGFLDLTVMKELEIPREELPRYRLLPNDVLFTEGGDWDKLGRSAVWPGEIDPCIHQNHIFRARLLTKDIDPQWVSMFCNSPVGRAYFEDAAKQTTNLATINMTELRHCPIPVPPPQEQRRILDRLHQIMSLLDDLEAKLRKQEDTATRLAESLAAAVAA